MNEAVRLFDITYVAHVVFPMASTGLEASSEPGVKEGSFLKNFFGAPKWEVVKNIMGSPDWKDIKAVQD